MSGGGASAAGGAGAPPAIPLASLGPVKARTTDLGGNHILKDYPREREYKAYCHNAHGAILMPDPRVPSVYTGKPRELRRLQVPENCAYVTVAEEGYETESTSIELAIFYEVWGKEENVPLFQDIILRNERGAQARSLVMQVLEAVEPTEGYNPAITLNPGTYPPTLVKPFCVWYYPPVHDPDPEKRTGSIYSFARSGIFPCGTPGCEVIVNLDNCRATTMSTEFLTWMYAGSVYPTVKDITEDEPLRDIISAEHPTDYHRFYNMYNYIINKWSCSQEALFIKFPGAHYNFVCRLDITESDREVLKIVPPGSRLLSIKGRTGLAEGITKFALSGKFPRKRSGNSRRNRNRHRRQSKRQTRKHRK